MLKISVARIFVSSFLGLLSFPSTALSDTASATKAPIFLSIPKSWLSGERDYRTTVSPPKSIRMEGTLSNVTYQNSQPRYEHIYFTPNGGSKADEVVIACSKADLPRCIDEPLEGIWDERGKQVRVGIHQELWMLVENTRAAKGHNPRVIIEGTMITKQHSKEHFASASDLNIYLVDGVVSEENEKSRKFRLQIAEKNAQDRAKKEAAKAARAAAPRDLFQEMGSLKLLAKHHVTPILKTGMTWTKADKFCRELSYAGLSGWTLPPLEIFKEVADSPNPQKGNFLSRFSESSGNGLIWTSTGGDGGHYAIANQTMVLFAKVDNHRDQNSNDVACSLKSS